MLTLYHGSDYLFTRFAFTNVGKKHGTSGGGFGIYLTDNIEDACKYGKYLYTVQFQPQKELSNTKQLLTREQVRTILRKFEQIADNSYIENFEYTNPVNQTAETKALTNLIKYSDTDVNLCNDIINATGGSLEMMQVLVSLGYTHTVDKVTPKTNISDGKSTTNYIIFNLAPQCVKIVKREVSADIANGFTDLNESDLLEFESGTKTGHQGKAKSKSQRRLFAMALAYKRGKLSDKYASEHIKKMAKSMDQETLHNYAATKQKRRKKNGQIGKRNNIPSYVKGSKYRPDVKNSKTLRPKK